MKLKTTATINIVLFGLLMGGVCYFLDNLLYQKYIERILSQDNLTISPYPQLSTFWNYPVPITLITIFYRLLVARFFKYSQSILSSLFVGISLGIICVVFSFALTWFNHSLGYYFWGKYEGYFYSLSDEFPLYLLILIPIVSVIYDTISSKIVKAN